MNLHVVLIPEIVCQQLSFLLTRITESYHFLTISGLHMCSPKGLLSPSFSLHYNFPAITIITGRFIDTMCRAANLRGACFYKTQTPLATAIIMMIWQLHWPVKSFHTYYIQIRVAQRLSKYFPTSRHSIQTIMTELHNVNKEDTHSTILRGCVKIAEKLRLES